MKKLLNTLYITTPGAGMRKDGENLVVDLDGEERARLPLHLLQSVVVFGGIYVSPGAIGACAAAGITLVFFNRVGRFEARVEGPVSGNVLLRRSQYILSDNSPIPIARSFVTGKVANQRTVLMRALRDHGTAMADEVRETANHTVDRLGRLLDAANKANFDTLDELRGLEGEAARLYFASFDAMIRVDDPAMRFIGRSRRPPLDPVNALLSFLYTLLTHDCRSAAESVGLDPAVGFLHRDRPGRPSLALDLMEELRPVLADRLALSLINRQQVGGQHFEKRDGGAVWLNDEGRRIVLAAWSDRKKTERRHDFLEETAPLGLVPCLQAQFLARHLRGDMDGYPPWFWK